jgi:hypothetical protein
MVRPSSYIAGCPRQLSRQAAIPKQIPIYVKLERAARHHSRQEPQARHELFHEINREELTSDLLSWLVGWSDTKVPQALSLRRPAGDGLGPEGLGRLCRE